MKGKNLFGRLSVLVLMLVVLAVGALAVPVGVERVEVNGVEMSPWSMNRLSVERGSDLAVEVRLLGYEKADNLELTAFITGYEHNDVEKLAAHSGVFSVEENELEVQRFKLSLPQDLARDSYKLRLFVSDRNGDELVQSYDLQVDVPRHKLSVKDVLTYPEGTVKAGQALLVRVRVENQGEKDEKDVKVTVSLPALGVSQSTYLNEVQADDEEQTEELYLKLPSGAVSGVYDLKTDVVFNNGRSSAQSLVSKVTVEGEAVAKPAEAAQTTQPAQTTVNVNVQQPTPQPAAESSKLRRGLEVVLLVLVALLVVVGLIIGFSKLKDDEDEE
ncbi:hypothetical protein HZA97_03985 [Candidatus Woesearchaeota archaeon]|nr:hypothetical protein [Candidatus Woesearchaeota archaeon]